MAGARQETQDNGWHSDKDVVWRNRWRRNALWSLMVMHAVKKQRWWSLISKRIAIYGTAISDITI
jgi:hypothetical protein